MSQGTWCFSGRLAGGKLELELTLTRDSSTVNPKCRSYAKLIAGSIHDDCLLLHEPLVLEQFPSPYTAKFATRSPLPADSAAVHVVASVILDRLIGLDITKKVTVPRTAKLQNGLPAASVQQSHAACTLTLQQQLPQGQQPHYQQQQQQQLPLTQKPHFHQEQRQQQQQGFASSARHGSGQQHNVDLLQQGAVCPSGQLQQLSHASATHLPKAAAPEVADGHEHISTPTSLPAAEWAEARHNHQQPSQGVGMRTVGQGTTAAEGRAGAPASAASGQGHGTLRQARLDPHLCGQTGSGLGSGTILGSQGAAGAGAGTLGDSDGAASKQAGTLRDTQGGTASGAGSPWGSQGPAATGADIQEAAGNETGTLGGPRGVPGYRSASCAASLSDAPWQYAEGGNGATATTTADAAKKNGKSSRRKLIHTISLPHAPSSSGPDASHANASMHSQGSDMPAARQAYGGTQQVQDLALTVAGSRVDHSSRALHYCNGWEVHMGSAIPFTTTAVPVATMMTTPGCFHAAMLFVQSDLLEIGAWLVKL